jgi:predicted NUDIX family NTP pyrophosphohydrolase
MSAPEYAQSRQQVVHFRTFLRIRRRGNEAQHGIQAMQTSAGTLPYRRGLRGIEVLIVHAAGNFNRDVPRGIPNGVPIPGESFVDAARRETQEETGIAPAERTPPGDAIYHSRHKHRRCFIGEAPQDAARRCACWEVAAAEFVPIEEAGTRMHQDQASFLDRLAVAFDEPSCPRVASDER